MYKTLEKKVTTEYAKPFTNREPIDLGGELIAIGTLELHAKIELYYSDGTIVTEFDLKVKNKR